MQYGNGKLLNLFDGDVTRGKAVAWQASLLLEPLVALIKKIRLSADFTWPL